MRQLGRKRVHWNIEPTNEPICFYHYLNVPLLHIIKYNGWMRHCLKLPICNNIWSENWCQKVKRNILTVISLKSLCSFLCYHFLFSFLFNSQYAISALRCTFWQTVPQHDLTGFWSESGDGWLCEKQDGLCNVEIRGYSVRCLSVWLVCILKSTGQAQ